MQKEITAGNYKSMKSTHRKTILHSGHGKNHPIQCENRSLQAYITVQHICLRFFRVLDFHEQ